jgi:hypothetical protein
MNPRKTTITILVTLSMPLALAEDFKTINGKEYKNATVSHIEADGIVLKTKSGISKVYFVELPKEVQERYGAKIAQPVAAEPAVAISGIEGLSPITVELKNEILGAIATSSSQRLFLSNAYSLIWGTNFLNLIRAVIYLRIPWTATSK